MRPVIEAVSAELLGPGTRVVDGAEATAAALAALLEDRAMGVEGSERGGMELLVTDLPDRFGEVASRFLGEDVSGLEVEQVDL